MSLLTSDFLGLGLDLVEDIVGDALYETRQLTSEQLLKLLEKDRHKVVSVEYTKPQSFSMDLDQPISGRWFKVKLHPIF